MITRKQTQRSGQGNYIQRRLSFEKLKETEMNQLILEKFENLAENLNNMTREMNSFKKEIKQEIREDLKEINQTVDKLTLEIQKTKQRVEILEFRNEKLENDLSKIINKKEEDLDERATLELKLKEKSIKIRGIPESKDQNDEETLEDLIIELAKFLDKDPTIFENEVDNKYRINSKIAKQKGYSRDVAIVFVRKTIRDKILSLHSSNPFCFRGQELKLLKDIPARILRRRKEYSSITYLLRKKNISYRWELPEGLSFWWENKRIRLLTSEQANKFIKQIKEHQQGKRPAEKRSEEEQLSREEEEEPETPLVPDLEYDDQDLAQEERRIRLEEERERKLKGNK